MFLIENVCKRSKIQKHKTINFLCKAFQYNTIYSVATIRFEPGEYYELAKNVSCLCRKISRKFTLRWRHNGRDSVSNHQPDDCLLNRLFRRRSKKTSKLRVTGLCVGNSPGTGEFPHKWPVTRKMLPFDDVIMLKLGVTDDWKVHQNSVRNMTRHPACNWTSRWGVPDMHQEMGVKSSAITVLTRLEPRVPERSRYGHPLVSLFVARANTQRNKHLIITSKRSFDVIITYLLRCVLGAGHLPTVVNVIAPYLCGNSDVTRNTTVTSREVLGSVAWSG